MSKRGAVPRGAILLLAAVMVGQPSCTEAPMRRLVVPPARNVPVAAPMASRDENDVPETTTLPRPRMLWRRVGEHLKTDSSGEARKVLAAEGGIVIIGGKTRLDARTGRDGQGNRSRGSSREAHAAEAGEADVEAVSTPNGVYLVGKEAITRRDAVSGQIDRRWPLPTYLRAYVESGAMRLASDGHRFVLLARTGTSLPEVMATGVDTSDAVTLLQRPMEIGNDQVVADGVLIVHDSYDGVVGAYDLGVSDAPLASLDGEAALAAVKAEVGDERLRCNRLAPLPRLGEHWLRVLANPTDPSFACALRHFEAAPQPRAAELLRQLADTPPPGDVEGEDMLVSILRTLAADDSEETSRWLVAFIGRAKGAPRATLQQRYAASMTVGLAWQQLWRTGRTSELGLCPREPLARQLPDLERSASDGSIGTAHPLLFQDMAPDGRWALVCQGRADTDSDGALRVMIGHHGDLYGDDASPYLIVGSGPGWAFDEFIGADPTGRYVAVREDACLSVVDTREKRAITLPGADLRDEGRFGSHRAVAFDATGSRMLYLRGNGPRVVLRDLSTGAESGMNAGAGLLWSARFDPEGRGLSVVTIPSGKWPVIRTSLAGRQCRGPISSFSMLGGTTPRRVQSYVPLDGGRPIEGDGILRMFDGALLVRQEEGALALRDARGADTVLVPAACRGVVRHADATRRSLLVTCAAERNAKDGKFSLWLYGPGAAVKLGEIYASRGDSVGGAPERFVQVGDLHIDMDARRAVPGPPLPPGRVRVVHDWRVLERGILAERSDGAVLRLKGNTRDLESSHLPDGPLVWQP